MISLTYLPFLLLLNQCSCFYNYFTNFTFLRENYNDKDNELENEIFDYTSIQIIVFAASVILLAVISLILCKLCSRHYRRATSPIFGRAPSISSIDRLVRERMQDCPPTYAESQNDLSFLPETEPPPYEQITRHSNTCSVFTIAKTGTVNHNILTGSDNASSCTEDNIVQSASPDYTTEDRIPVYNNSDEELRNRLGNNPTMTEERHRVSHI